MKRALDIIEVVLPMSVAFLAGWAMCHFDWPKATCFYVLFIALKMPRKET